MFPRGVALTAEERIRELDQNACLTARVSELSNTVLIGWMKLRGSRRNLVLIILVLFLPLALLGNVRGRTRNDR